MKLYIGGAFQGQEALARQENPGVEICPAFHETLRQVMRESGDPEGYVRAFIASHPQAVVVADEIGCGIVPMDAGERAWREAVGRGLCRIAQASERVTRVCCGIGVVIK